MRIDSLRASTSSWQAMACSAPLARANSSTLSNSWLRSSPRVSRPAEPGLAPEAGRVGHVAQREVGLVEHLVAVQRRERHLGGGDGPQVVALDVVAVLVELREVAGGDHRLGAHERRRADLLVGVAVAVEAQLHHGPQQAGAPAPVHREHRARDLHRPLGVEDAEVGADVPVGHALVVAVGSRRRSPRCGGRRCRPRRRRPGRRPTGRWGCAGAGRGPARPSASASASSAFSSSPSARLSAMTRLGAGVVAVLAEPADVLRQRLDAGPDLVPTGAEGPLLGVEVDDLARRCPPRRRRGGTARRGRRRGRSGCGGGRARRRR